MSQRILAMKRNVNSILSGLRPGESNYSDNASVPGPSSSRSDTDTSQSDSSADEAERANESAATCSRNNQWKETVVRKTAYSQTRVASQGTSSTAEETELLTNGDDTTGISDESQELESDYEKKENLNEEKDQRKWCSVM